VPVWEQEALKIVVEMGYEKNMAESAVRNHGLGNTNDIGAIVAAAVHSILIWLGEEDD
jgi:hypothetical protein